MDSKGPCEEDDWEWTDEEDPSPSGKKVPSCRAVNGEVGPSRPRLVSHFIEMGFPEEMVNRAVKEHGEGGMEVILDTLLTYSVIERSTPALDNSSSKSVSSQSEGDIVDEDTSNMDSFGDEENVEDFSEKDKKLLQLVEMGFFADDVSSAIDRCGPDASFLELADSIRAAQMAEESDGYLSQPQESSTDEDEKACSDDPPREKKKRVWLQQRRRRRQPPTRARPRTRAEQPTCSLPNPMVGFGLPADPQRATRRELPEGAAGPPYFYFENVALAPKGVWETMSQFLYGVEPEFVDSKHFCAAARKRGYIHNLPIDGRDQLHPVPPLSIHEALPATRKWWPSWDRRTKLNCLQTCTATARLTERIRAAVAGAGGDPPAPDVQRFVLEECRKWNLVWVGLHKVAPLEPDEVEMLLGFPKNHTRGGGISRTERFRSLGNSFQVDTVAYHLSVLKAIFPQGLRVLSLFSGIGGAEVALHRLGIHLKVVVSVEISEVNRNIVRAWWAQTEQEGTLIDIADVQEVDEEKLKELIGRYGGFDLVVGGSPCNNLSGSNRVSRHGLEGSHSSLFFEYFRILDFVRSFARGRI
ncbi:unnamed protein product [Spirodela intermedia]|uniref:DNA (cytosine-5-)-methyltransferase n=1 Tax=Spirodela intermedia TaxID=51605 RepID=A0A7I8KWZ0_SPIIN|nr:unnamed protein product [Spirodela intermedia]